MLLLIELPVEVLEVEKVGQLQLIQVRELQF
jgi:hypothetical protein